MGSVGEAEQERAYYEALARAICEETSDKDIVIPTWFWPVANRLWCAAIEHGQELRGCCDHGEKPNA